MHVQVEIQTSIAQQFGDWFGHPGASIEDALRGLYGRPSERIGRKYAVILQTTGYIFYFCEIESRDHWRGVNDARLNWMQFTDAGMRRMISPRQGHIANALIQARVQTTPRVLQYDMLNSTSTFEPVGINRPVYISMGELKPMQGYTYYFRILAVCYNVMQTIPKGECSNWAALSRDYMRKHYPAWRKERITMLMGDARAIHWTDHMD
eukprot:12406633-Karenia_brevis.AAC.1